MKKKGTKNRFPLAKWTEQEDALIREKYQSIGAKQIARILKNRSWTAVETRARVKFGLKSGVRYFFPKGDKHPAWNGGWHLDGQGYKFIYAPDECDTKNGYIYEHRLVMQRHLGRRLTSEDFVHHKNEDKLDNRLENLELTTNSEHTTMHGKARTGGKWSILYEKCVDCGTTSIKHIAHGQCAKCHRRARTVRERRQ